MLQLALGTIVEVNPHQTTHFKIYPETVTTFIRLSLGLDLVVCLGFSDILYILYSVGRERPGAPA